MENLKAIKTALFGQSLHWFTLILSYKQQRHHVVKYVHSALYQEDSQNTTFTI